MPDDSALFSVKLKTDFSESMLTDSLPLIPYSAAEMSIYNNDPSKQEFKVSFITEASIPVINKLNLRLLIQGLYKSEIDSMKSDTIQLNLRNISSPFEIVDSVKGNLSDSGIVNLRFLDLPNDGIYFLQITHRNSIETWSSLPGLIFYDNMLEYNFTDSVTKAFGENLILVNDSLQRFAIISGDVNQDGSIDGTDMLLIDNDAASLLTGYVSTDVNGDGFVDGTDALITANNAENYVVKITP